MWSNIVVNIYIGKYHILKTCHASNLWIIENFAGFTFCSLRVSLAKSQWARLLLIVYYLTLSHTYQTLLHTHLTT